MPNVTLNPKDTSVCYDDTVIFVASGALNYVWYQNQDSVFGENEYELISDSSINVILEVDSNGCINKDTSMISVLPIPKIQLNTDTALCFGDFLELKISWR